MRIEPGISLVFNGECDAAFAFYQHCLGATLTFRLTWGDSPMAGMAPPEWRDKIIHATLTLGGKSLSGGDVFHVIAPGCADGMRVDAAGNLWSSAGDGVHCLAPDGRRLGRILVPETVSNICFGGRHGHRLFITATTSLYAVSLAIRGATRTAR